MRQLRIILHVVLTLALLPLVATPLAQADVDIYTTPGYHNVNGRDWHTTCEPYSQTTRCVTNIKATQVNQVGGRFVSTTGWVFNNLTYAASPRALWKSNPLGGNGAVGGAVAWTAADGRKWRTECDSTVTGRGGCRSYIEASSIETYRTSKGATAYRWKTEWTFNSMVRFSMGSVVHPTAPPMKSAPAFLKGRRHFTLGTIVTQTNAGTQTRGIGRLSNIELDPGGKLGTFRESYWTYTFDMAVEGDYAQFRTSIPNLPKGCKTSENEAKLRPQLNMPALPSGACDVRTARTFVGKPTVRSGTYEVIVVSGGNAVRMYWQNSPLIETYLDVTRQAPRSADPAVVRQSIFPYNAGGRDQTLWTQIVGGSKLLASRQAFKFQDYVSTGSGCIVTPPAARGRVVSGWHSYMCPLTSDNKMVWHNIASSLVAEGHGLCPAYVPGTDATAHWNRCNAASTVAVDYSMPARPGGHVYEALQVIDDNDKLVGIVGLESSLYSQKLSSKSQLGLFAAVSPGG